MYVSTGGEVVVYHGLAEKVKSTLARCGVLFGAYREIYTEYYFWMLDSTFIKRGFGWMGGCGSITSVYFDSESIR